MTTLSSWNFSSNSTPYSEKSCNGVPRFRRRTFFTHSAHRPRFPTVFKQISKENGDSRSFGVSAMASPADSSEEEEEDNNLRDVKPSSSPIFGDTEVRTGYHWRKNLPFLAKSYRVFAIDLLGYGYSDKPNPQSFSSLYTFETWANQINDFCNDIVKDRAFFICNSIGGIVGLQAAIMDPHLCGGVLLLNISLRMLHIKKQPWYARPFIRSFQNLLRNTGFGKLFFQAVATRDSVRSILCQCYHDKSKVTDELIDSILLPGLEPGAAEVFLQFIGYSGGPLPEELLSQVKCPVLIGWGDKDPWEPIELGKVYGDFDVVEDFVVLPNVGHCPQDEAPDLVNPLVVSFVTRHSSHQTKVPAGVS